MYIYIYMCIHLYIHAHMYIYRKLMEDREEAYRHMWKEEEARSKDVAEETKTNLKIVRDHLIGILDAKSPVYSEKRPVFS